MLTILALVIVLFCVSFLDTGISLDEYSETLLYVPEEPRGEEAPKESPAVDASEEFKAATVDAEADADEMLERIYSGGK